MSKIPDFLIVGAAKSGTTSLHRYLSQHPQIFLPAIKETWFFCSFNNPNQTVPKKYPELPSSWEEYLSFFKDAAADQLIGEATPAYLYYDQLTITNIKRFHPNWKELKIIIILREPISKIISHYRYVQNKGIDPDGLALWPALQKEDDRKQNNELSYDLHYVSNTRYYQQLKAYLDTFPNCKVVLFDQLKQNSKNLLQGITSFLGVTDFDFSLDMVHNRSKARKVARNSGVEWMMDNGRMLKRLLPKGFKKRLKNQLLKEEVASEEALAYLRPIFRKEIQLLQEIVDHDLSSWLKKYD